MSAATKEPQPWWTIGVAGLVCLALTALVAAAPPPAAESAAAPEAEGRSGVLRTLVVGEGETVASAVCIGCSVVVRGVVTGDSVAILGGVDVSGASGRGPQDDVVAVGGAVRVRRGGRVPAAIVAIGGPAQIEPGAEASYDVDALPWLHVPGQRQVFAEGALTLVVSALVVGLLGASLLRRAGIERREAVVRRRPFACALGGFVLFATLVCVLAGGEGPGRFEDLVETVCGLALTAALVLGFGGVASAVGRLAARAARGPIEAGWRSTLLGALVIGLLCLVPLAGALVALVALLVSCGAVFVRRATLPASQS